MAGSCWRLLAAFSLILVLPTVLRGQDAAPPRSQAAARPQAAATVFASELAPHQARPSDSSSESSSGSPVAPVWIPPPIVSGPPRRSPPGRSSLGHPPLAPGAGVFEQLVRAAGIIFSGRVTFVAASASPFGQGQSSTAVTFQVEHALRGTSLGQNLTIHEWAGLWASGERYCVGERVLLFLYAPSKLGLTSPVEGGEGRFAMNAHGQIVMNPRHVITLAEDPILGGKTIIPYSDFARAIHLSNGEE